MKMRPETQTGFLLCGKEWTEGEALEVRSPWDQGLVGLSLIHILREIVQQAGVILVDGGQRVLDARKSRVEDHLQDVYKRQVIGVGEPQGKLLGSSLDNWISIPVSYTHLRIVIGR